MLPVWAAQSAPHGAMDSKGTFISLVLEVTFSIKLSTEVFMFHVMRGYMVSLVISVHNRTVRL